MEEVNKFLDWLKDKIYTCDAETNELLIAVDENNDSVSCITDTCRWVAARELMKQ